MKECQAEGAIAFITNPEISIKVVAVAGSACLHAAMQEEGIALTNDTCRGPNECLLARLRNK